MQATDATSSSKPVSVLAVVVTHHPGPGLMRHLQAIRAQVDELLVVDNGSPAAAGVAATARDAGAGFLGNAGNEGMARALNQALDHARQHGHAWLAMFDQDSLAPPRMIEGLLALLPEHAEPKRVAMVATGFFDRHLGRAYHDPSNVLFDAPRWRAVKTLITSGSVLRVASADAVGGFDERYFIDFVDHEHCQRLRRGGWHLLQSKTLLIEHAIGSLTKHRFLWRTVHCSNHSATRRYYITRNQLEFYSRSLFVEPRLALWGFANLALRSALTLLYETDRAAKAGAIARGAWHFATRRFGRL